MKMTVILVCAIAGLGCTCRNISYDGVTYSHRSFGTTSSFGKLTINHPSGASVEIENFSNDQVGAIREVKDLIQEVNKLKP